MNIKAATDRFSFKYKDDIITITQSKGQPDLYAVDLNSEFKGWVINKHGTMEIESILQADVELLKAIISEFNQRFDSTNNLNA